MGNLGYGINNFLNICWNIIGKFIGLLDSFAIQALASTI
jgi:hypothetical protein